MTLSPEKAGVDLGRAAGEGATPAVAAWRAALRWLIVLAFVSRGLLSLFEAVSMATGAFQSVAPVSAESLDSYSPFWPAIWGALSTLTAAALVARLRTGWLVGVAVTVAYLVAGITNASAQAAALGADAGAAFFIVVVGLILPVVMLGGLSSIRLWYLPASRPLSRLGRARLERTTPSTLERWRRRN